MAFLKKLAGDAWNAIGPSGDKVADGWDFDRDDVDTATFDSAHGNWVWVSDNLKSIEGSWSTLIYWDNKHQRYAKTILAPGDDEYMKLGHGYWIWISNPNGDTLSAVTGDHKKY